MKTSTQLKALVRNLSKSRNVEAEIILRNFMLERFLERVAASKYKSNFILRWNADCRHGRYRYPLNNGFRRYHQRPKLD